MYLAGYIRSADGRLPGWKIQGVGLLRLATYGIIGVTLAHAIVWYLPGASGLVLTLFGPKKL